MTDATVILIPFRGDGGWRSRNLEVVIGQAEQLGWPVHLGDSGDAPFSIARTWNLLADEAGDWDHAVRWAADFMIEDLSSIVEAVDRCEYYTFAFDRITHLDERETAEVHAGGEFPTRNDKLPFGGVNVVTREAWDVIGGFDPRFLGWGHEDRAFVHAVETLFGKRQRVPGRMFNLWHPRDTDPDYWARREGNLQMYRDDYRSIADPEALREFLAKR